ncbi:MAG: hypothetical protein ISR99_00335 [Parcubacteria group bacterium]|nr:hypothetical protein [Parcubacteria group bacterium]
MSKKEECLFDKERADMVNAMFDAVIHETGKRELEILREIYGDTQDVVEMLWHLLRNISECPEKVIIHCQKLLNSQT